MPKCFYYALRLCAKIRHLDLDLARILIVVGILLIMLVVLISLISFCIWNSIIFSKKAEESDRRIVDLILSEKHDFTISGTQHNNTATTGSVHQEALTTETTRYNVDSGECAQHNSRTQMDSSMLQSTYA